LFISLGFLLYQFGLHRQGFTASRASAPPTVGIERLSLEQQISDFSHQRELARAQIEQRDKTIARLKGQLSS
jgi:hypothetical protein